MRITSTRTGLLGHVDRTRMAVDTDRPDPRVADWRPAMAVRSMAYTSDESYWKAMVEANIIAGDPQYYSGGYASNQEYAVAMNQIIESGLVSRSTVYAHMPPQRT